MAHNVKLMRSSTQASTHRSFPQPDVDNGLPPPGEKQLLHNLLLSKVGPAILDGAEPTGEDVLHVGKTPLKAEDAQQAYLTMPSPHQPSQQGLCKQCQQGPLPELEAMRVHEERDMTEEQFRCCRNFCSSMSPCATSISMDALARGTSTMRLAIWQRMARGGR
jgi:hypothetical protein